ncbi:MAG: hypothetical protein V8Q21_01630 [Akkermansia muciniphila]
MPNDKQKSKIDNPKIKVSTPPKEKERNILLENESYVSFSIREVHASPKKNNREALEGRDWKSSAIQGRRTPPPPTKK